MEDNDGGISLGEIFKLLLKKIWWIVAVTAICVAAAICIVQFLYNPSAQTYTAEFTLRMPFGDVYPDNTVINLYDTVRLANLTAVKESGEEFADVDVASLFGEDGIKFTRETKQSEADTYYKNSVKIVKKYFKNDAVAVDFLKAVVESPVKNAIRIAENKDYGENLKKYNAALTYEDKIAALTAQKEYLISVYEKIGGLYGNGYIPSAPQNKKTIGECIAEVGDILNATEQSYLAEQIRLNNYYWDAQTALEGLRADIADAQRETAENEAIIDGQYGEMQRFLQAVPPETQGSGISDRISSFTDKIAEYRLKNDALNQKIEDWQKKADDIANYTEGDGKAEKEAFDDRLDGTRDRLDGLTAELKSIVVATYNDKAEIIYSNNKIEPEGGMSLIAAALLGGVAGLLASCAVALIILIPAYRREKAAELKAQNGDDGNGGNS